MQAKVRKKELQRMRTLMSYYEKKCKRWKKIKSKRWSGIAKLPVVLGACIVFEKNTTLGSVV